MADLSWIIPSHLLLIFVITSAFCLVLHNAQLQRVEHAPTTHGSLSFLVVGDWGRRGAYNQTRVASQMGVVGKKLNIDFVISTGDNFYDDGLTGVYDPAFSESFSNIYIHPSLQKPWYVVLGNHDYRGDVEAQLSPILADLDKRWVCLRSYTLNAGEMADFFFVDTTPFLDHYFNDEPGDGVYDWRGVLPRDDYIFNLLNDLELSLRNSRAKWKIVVGHHTIMSAGQHGITGELFDQLLPILEMNNVDLYINGHDHCLQHISSSNSQVQFMTSGGGSKAWRGDIRWWEPEEMKFYHDGQGFMSLLLTETRLDIVFYDVFGKQMHKWSTTKYYSTI